MKITKKIFVEVLLCLSAACFIARTADTMDTNRLAHFLPEERRAIEDYYHHGKGGKVKGLPPGLAKRGGNLPPGLQKHLEKNGQLPPGLQKRIEPLPADLDRRLPSLPEYWERVVLDNNVILLDRRTNRILDIIENVIGLATGQ